MYYFDFDMKSKGNMVRVSEFKDILHYSMNCNHQRFMTVELDPNGGNNTRWGLVPVEEGVIGNRKFWLKDLDYDRANDIIDNYFKEKFVKRFKTDKTRKYKEVEA